MFSNYNHSNFRSMSNTHFERDSGGDVRMEAWQMFYKASFSSG